MKKGIVILSTLLLTCFTGTSAQEKIDFYDVVDGYTTNGYVILRAEDGTPSDEVRLVGRNLDMNSISTYYGREEVPDEVTHEGKTYKVVEFGYFDDTELSLRCLKFGKNMRKVNVSREGFFLVNGFEVSEENSYLKAIDNILYTADGKTLLKCAWGFNPLDPNYPLSTSDVINIPDDVEIISPQAFSSQSNVAISKLPKSLKEIGEGAFFDFKKIPEELEIPEGVKVIGPEAFNCTSIHKLTLPSTLEEFGCLGTMLKLDSLICQAPIPPTATAFYMSPEDNNPRWPVWYDYYQNAVLLVPEGSVELYSRHREWGLFKNIVAISTTGIAPQVATNTKKGQLYRLDGTPALGTKPGLYIQNGKKIINNK